MNNVFWKGFIAGFFCFLFTAYAFFRFYWIKEIGTTYFRWHSVLWLYLFVAGCFVGLSYWLYKSGKLNVPFVQRVYLILFGLVGGLYTAEGFLRLTGIGETYSEQRNGYFVDPAACAERTGLMTWMPHQQIVLKADGEYSFQRNTNSEGLSDREWPLAKDSNEVRIITLGDSFTEGDGCAADSSYPKVLEQMLQREYPKMKINVMNAGRCGSDPWFEYKKLHNRLLKYKPDIVIYTNGSNDLLFDHLMYGGMERFVSDSVIKNKIPHHGWLGMYAVSYVFRVVMNGVGYNRTLFGVKDREENALSAIVDAKRLAVMYSQLAKDNGFKCVQLIRPEKSEMIDDKYDFNVNALSTRLDTLSNFRTFDLRAFYKDSLHVKPEQVKNYFWPIDEHHNAKGYAAMAKGVYACIGPDVAEMSKNKK